MGYNIHEHKKILLYLDNSLLFTESIQNITQIFSIAGVHNVRFLPCQHWGAGVKKGNPVYRFTILTPAE